MRNHGFFSFRDADAFSIRLNAASAASPTRFSPPRYNACNPRKGVS
jgi:hypothetical protein